MSDHSTAKTPAFTADTRLKQQFVGRRSCPTGHYLRDTSPTSLVDRLPQLAKLHHTTRSRTPAVAISNHTLLIEEQDRGMQALQPLHFLASKGGCLALAMKRSIMSEPTLKAVLAGCCGDLCTAASHLINIEVSSHSTSDLPPRTS